MRGCSAQAVPPGCSGEREHFEDAAAAISAANIEFVVLPSHSSQLGELVKYWLCLVGSKRRVDGSIVAKGYQIRFWERRVPRRLIPLLARALAIVWREQWPNPSISLSAHSIFFSGGSSNE